jgi:hypothetical protein
VIAEGDKLVAWNTVTDTQQGEYLRRPSSTSFRKCDSLA